MPRVVPSLVVAAIDSIFPAAAHGQDPGNIGAEYAGRLQAIVRLVAEVPAELLTVSGSDYMSLVTETELLKNKIDMWTSRGPTGAVTGTAVTAIRRVLQLCPDEAPTPTTSSILFVRPDELRASIRLDISSAFAGLHSGEWKAATVLGGAAIEALLLWAIETRKSAGIALPSTVPKTPLDRWNLTEYIAAASDIGLIQVQTRTLAEQVRDFRNLIHPGRAARTAMQCSRATTLAALSALDFVVADLTKAFT